MKESNQFHILWKESALITKSTLFFVYWSIHLSYSGAVVKNISVTKKLLADFIVESFFSPLQVKQYIEQKANCYLTFESFGRYPLFYAFQTGKHITLYSGRSQSSCNSSGGRQ